MSGGKLDSIRLINGSINSISKCSKTTYAPKEFKTKSGISLGMSIKKFKEIMGEPSGTKGNLLFYTYCHTRPLKPGDTWCVYDGKSMAARCSGITASFVDGNLQWLEISFMTDYVC